MFGYGKSLFTDATLFGKMCCGAHAVFIFLFMNVRNQPQYFVSINM